MSSNPPPPHRPSSLPPGAVPGADKTVGAKSNAAPELLPPAIPDAPPPYSSKEGVEVNDNSFDNNDNDETGNLVGRESITTKAVSARFAAMEVQTVSHVRVSTASTSDKPHPPPARRATPPPTAMQTAIAGSQSGSNEVTAVLLGAKDEDDDDAGNPFHSDKDDDETTPSIPPPPAKAKFSSVEVTANDTGTSVSHSAINSGNFKAMDADHKAFEEWKAAGGVITHASFLTELTSGAVDDAEKHDVNNLNAHNLPNQAGFSRTTRRRLEMPADMLKRVLLVGETVTGEFDYYYPTQKVLKSLVTHVKLTIVTLGLYLLWAFCQYIVRCIQKFIGIESTASYRGKMVVTSKGRLVFWQVKARQWRWFGIDGRAYFDSAEITRIMHIRDIRETTVRFSRTSALICCCMDSKASLEVVFNAFPYDRHEYSKNFYTAPSWEYINEVYNESGAFATFMSFANPFSWNSKAKNTLSSMQTAQALVLRLVSKEGDLAFNNGDHGMRSFEDILMLNQRLSDHLHVAGEAFSAESSTVIQGHCDDMFDFKIVEDDDRVVLPTRYIPLTKNERVISTVGQHYKVTCWDICKVFATIGMSWLFSLRHKQKQRTAHVLTNNRIIELWIEAHDGKVTNSVSQHIRVRIRSIFPGKVYSGYVSSDGNEFLKSSILTPAGQMALVLPLTQEAAFFAQAMQSVSTRKPLDLNTKEVASLANSEEKRLSDIQNAGKIGLENELCGQANNLPFQVGQLLPLIKGEKVIFYYDTNSKGEGLSDGGRLAITNRTVMRITQSSRGCCWPFTLSKKVLVGDQTKARNSISDHTGKFGADLSHNPFFVVWVPAQEIVGQELSVFSTGAHPVAFCCSLLRWASPTKSFEKYKFDLQTKLGFNLPLVGSQHFTNYEYDCLCRKHVEGDMPYLYDNQLNELFQVVSLLQHTPVLPLPPDDDSIV